MTKWRQIWEGKRLDTSSVDETLVTLIKADGFDSICGDYSVDQWKIMVQQVIALSGVHEKSSVLEIGCGSGALLYELHQRTGCDVAGVDYSQSLIKIAESVLPGTFIYGEADSFAFPENHFDLVLAHSVFQYFPDHIYAINVITKMYQALKPGGIILLMDLNDDAQKSVYHDERRKNYENPEIYDEKYTEYPHLFFEKAALVAQMQQIGFQEITFFEHAVAAYINARFRFNVKAMKSVG